MRILALLTILLIAGAQASIVADELQTKQANLDGIGNFLWVADEANFPQWEVRLQAHSIVVEQTSQEYVTLLESQQIGPRPIPSIELPTNPTNGPTTEVSHYQNVRGNLSYIQPGVAMAMQLSNADFAASLGKQIIRQYNDPLFDGVSGFQESADFTTEGGTFSSKKFNDPLLISELESGNILINITGDLVLESEYMDFALETSQGPVTIRSTHTVSDSPSPSTSMRMERSLRVTLVDATIELRVEKFQGILQQAFQEAQLDGLQQPRVINATGTIGNLELHQQSAGLFEDSLQLQRGDEQLAAGKPAKTESATALFQIAGNSTQFLWALLLLPILLLARPKATYQRMEGAIEEGKFRKATRIANKLLRRKPDEERATLGWAIAQSKCGNYQEAATRLEKWLSKHEATDGVFPYVIGMAYMDLGNQKEAANWFDVAVQMTPSLENEIPRGPVVAEHAYV